MELVSVPFFNAETEIFSILKRKIQRWNITEGNSLSILRSVSKKYAWRLTPSNSIVKMERWFVSQLEEKSISPAVLIAHKHSNSRVHQGWSGVFRNLCLEVWLMVWFWSKVVCHSESNPARDFFAFSKRIARRRNRSSGLGATANRLDCHSIHALTNWNPWKMVPTKTRTAVQNRNGRPPKRNWSIVWLSSSLFPSTLL